MRLSACMSQQTALPMASEAPCEENRSSSRARCGPRAAGLAVGPLHHSCSHETRLSDNRAGPRPSGCRCRPSLRDKP